LAELSSSFIGTLSKSAISASHEAEIVGISSRGWFLRLRPHWIVFLSRESPRGPLTINVPGLPYPEIQIPYPQPLPVQSGNFFLPELDLTIETQNSQVWNPPAPPHADESARIFVRLQELARLVLLTKQGAGLSYLLTDLLHLDVHLPATERKYTADFNTSLAIDHLEHAHWDELTRMCLRILGRGPGLTPSGDDLIIGILLALSRAQAYRERRLDFTRFSENMLANVYLRTTTLSGNLIECATLGLADERLITALDAVLAESTPIETAANCLCAWGNSSGGDVLLGMTLTLCAIYSA
jgi:hypothetical protein